MAKGLRENKVQLLQSKLIYRVFSFLAPITRSREIDCDHAILTPGWCIVFSSHWILGKKLSKLWSPGEIPIEKYILIKYLAMLQELIRTHF